MSIASQPTQGSGVASENRWTARPNAARLIRFLIWFTPIVLSFMFIWYVSDRWPPAELGIGLLTWWAIFGVLGFAVLLGTDRVVRRLLPFTALLQMALLFPDKAPNRFGEALRSGTAGKLFKRSPPTSHTLLDLVRAIGRHDRGTLGHSERVRAYAHVIGTELNMTEDELDRLSWAALLHDVGKLDIEPNLLNKDGHPDESEWHELRKHPALSAAYLGSLDTWIGDWARAASEHHERWDGKGYPAGLEGEEIHPAARVVAVADAYDVMTSVRSYKSASTTAYAREEIARNAGTQFDPAAARAMLNAGIGQVSNKWGALPWLLRLPELMARAPAAALTTAVVAGAAAGVIAPVTDPEPAAPEVAQAPAPTPTPEPTPTAEPPLPPAAAPPNTPTATAEPTPDRDRRSRRGHCRTGPSARSPACSHCASRTHGDTEPDADADLDTNSLQRRRL